jgi:exopolysaccharide biosynthesis polyprenyl glycosylphosphotransferase
VSTASLNPARKAERSEWARLIPGEMPVMGNPGKKRPQSVRLLAVGRKSLDRTANVDSRHENALGLLLPRPLQSRIGLRWARSMAADFVLIAVSWLAMGALLAGLRAAPPRVRWCEFGEMAALSLLGIAFLHAALITLLGYSEGLHVETMSLRRQALILGKSVLWATAVLCLTYALQGAPWFTNGLFCGAGILGFGALWGWRWWAWERDRIAHRPGDLRHVLIVGAGDVGRRVASYMEENPAGRSVCGFLDDDRPGGEGVLGGVRDLARIAREKFIDEVILAGPRSSELTRQVLEEARELKLDVEIVPDLFGCKPAGHEMERVGGLPVICVHAERLPAAGLVLKRVVDVLGAGLSLVVLSPVLLVLAILIKIDSPGPILYCAERAGRKGRLFRCYKFRTMVRNAGDLKEQLRRNNERSGPIFKIADDPRITRLGRYLRRYSLDELPQLWNVVTGDMSLVGPRPHPLDDVAEYEIEHLARLDVTPGITGLWQVTARRDPSFVRGMELDREYIRTWSLGLDFRILFRTVLAVVGGSGE